MEKRPTAQEKEESASIYYEVLPQIKEYTLEEYNNFFNQPVYTQKPETEKVASPYLLPITKLEMNYLLKDGNTSHDIMIFFIRFIHNTILLHNIEKPAAILAFNVNSFTKAEKAITYDYLSTLSNQFKDNKQEITTKKLTLILVFFYDGRWMVTFYDNQKNKARLFDFLDKSKSKVQKEEVYEVVKAYLKQEFGFNPPSFTFYDKNRSSTPVNCGTHVCRLLTHYYITNVDYEKIQITELEKNLFKQTLAWLIMKVDEIRRTIEAEEEEAGSYNKLLPDDILAATMTQRNKSAPKKEAQNNIHNIPTEGPEMPSTVRGEVVKSNYKDKGLEEMIGDMKESDKLKLKKSDLVEMLNKVKADVLEKFETSHDETRISKMIKREGLFEDSKVSREALSKSAIKDLMKKVKRQDNHHHQHSHRDRDEDEPMTQEEYARKQYENAQKQQEFYGMLSYIQRSNPSLYMKISDELNNQAEDKFLQQFNLLHVKYPQQSQPKLRLSHHLLTPNNPFGQSQAQLEREVRGSIIGQNLADYNFGRSSHINVAEEYQQPQPQYNSNPLLSHKSMAPPRASVFGMPEGPKTPIKTASTRGNNRNNISGFNQGLSPLQMAGKTSLQPNMGTGFNSGMDHPSRGQQPNQWPSSPERKGAFGSEDNPKKQTVAKRYGAEISRFDFQRLKKEKVLTNPVINFFLGYLREKQKYMDPNRIKNFELNTYSFGPELYQAMTNNGTTGRRINYEGVKNFTSKVTEAGKTIFETFNKVIMVVETAPEHYALVHVDTTDKKIYLFDPNKPREKTPSENPILLNIYQYVGWEIYDKTKKKPDMTKWQMVYGSVMKPSNMKESSLVIAKMAHNIHRGSLQGQYNDETLEKFKTDLMDLILRIGITDDKNTNMNWMGSYAL